MTTVDVQTPAFGSLMREWRQRRRLSQLDLAIEADVSARHVSFIETGRSTPSRAMVLRLATVLDVPLREQNQLLLAAGLAPVYGERSLDDPDMAAVREGVERVLGAYNPFPCVVVDSVADRVGQRRRCCAHRGCRAEPPRAAERASHGPASRGSGAAHPEPFSVAASPDRAVAARGGGERIDRTAGAADRDRVLSRRIRGDPRSRRRRGSAWSCTPRRENC